MVAFKALIVGGSISGLALANMLEALDIDYELLEAYPSIAPDLGYVLVMQPSGLRILEQLGCLDAVRKCSVQIQAVKMSGPNGFNFPMESFTQGMQEMS
jgi:2-polyprenyl-6-methoxyphenol hydroxylase-like FAD-dependent oxidoreductase